MNTRLVSVGLGIALMASTASAQRPADTIAASGGEFRIVPLAHATLQIVYGDVVILVDPAHFRAAAWRCACGTGIRSFATSTVQ
jgi:hypothetical protein